MIVALVSVHWGHGLFAATNGIEVPLLYAASAAALAFTGPGRYSLDAPHASRAEAARSRRPRLQIVWFEPATVRTSNLDAPV
jgi:hypothetical protein